MPVTRVERRPKPQKSAPQPPSLMLVGGERLILPEGRVPRRAWPDLAYAMLLEPAEAELTAWMTRLEATLGVNDNHRQAMADRAISAVEGSADKRRRLLDQHRHASSLRSEMRDPVFEAAIGEKIAAATIHRARAADLRAQNAKKNRHPAKAADRMAEKLDREVLELRLQEADQDRLYADAKEPILRAKARGEDVDIREAVTADFARDEWGARIIEDGLPALVYGEATRAKNLTGIEHAKHAGYLGGWREAERLHKVGVDYREAYIVVEGEASGGGEGGGGGGPKAPQPRQIEMGQRLADMRRGLNPRQRDVIDLVCGQDMRLREATLRLGLGDPRTTERALRTGLAAAAESLSIERERRIADGTAGDLGRRVKAVSAMLRKVRV